MNKDELKKEAEEYISDNCKRWESDGLTVDDIANETYLAGAESREKRIAELETRCNELFLQTCEQAEKIKELKSEIENDRDLPAIAYMQGAEKQKKKDADQLTKAKEIIKNLMVFAEMDDREYEKEYKEAEQFISEVEK